MTTTPPTGCGPRGRATYDSITSPLYPGYETVSAIMPSYSYMQPPSMSRNLGGCGPSVPTRGLQPPCIVQPGRRSASSRSAPAEAAVPFELFGPYHFGALL